MNVQGGLPQLHEKCAQPSKEKGLWVIFRSRNRILSVDLIRRAFNSKRQAWWRSSEFRSNHGAQVTQDLARRPISSIWQTCGSKPSSRSPRPSQKETIALLSRGTRVCLPAWWGVFDLVEEQGIQPSLVRSWSRSWNSKLCQNYRFDLVKELQVWARPKSPRPGRGA